MEHNILIVEDESITALDLKRKLEKLDYRAFTASNYDEALNVVSNENISIVFMDVNLNSEKDGVDTANAIVEYNNNIQIIFLTGQSEKETVERAAKLNPLGYITKPFKKNQIEAIVNLAESKQVIKDNLLDECEEVLSKFELLSEHIKTIFKHSGEMDAKELSNFISLVNVLLDNEINKFKDIVEK